MKYILLIAIAIQLQAGFFYVKEKHTDCKTTEQSKFVLECIKNGNPKSDEEPEDWIYMCKTMSLSMFCKTEKYGLFNDNRFWSQDISCECGSCFDDEAKSACKSRGF